MNAWIGIVYSLAVVSALTGAVEQTHLSRQIEASRAIKSGDTKTQVRAILGAPLSQWEHPGLFSGGPPQWSYGTIFEPRDVVNGDGVLPMALPIKLRLFGPVQSDLIVEWNEDGRVARISRP